MKMVENRRKADENYKFYREIPLHGKIEGKTAGERRKVLTRGENRTKLNERAKICIAFFVCQYSASEYATYYNHRR